MSEELLLWTKIGIAISGAFFSFVAGIMSATALVMKKMNGFVEKDKFEEYLSDFKKEIKEDFNRVHERMDYFYKEK